MSVQSILSSLDLSNNEFQNIDEYRKKKNTAVLTIMFTDIQGFTALTETKGESYVHALHEEHDRILVGTIEENNAGIVIKYIGDSIMAIFAEPTAAVEKALSIQRKLNEFNLAHPELDDLKVRIGLHMGQTVIENKIQTDLFGRHVNKASRIESLAAGGHVYASYTVFDSVKSWIIDSPNAAWILHGSYRLKGIDRPEEIYEFYNEDITKSESPRSARPVGALPVKSIVVAACAIALVAALVAFGAFAFGRNKGDAGSQAAPNDAAATAVATPTGTAEPAAGSPATPAAQPATAAQPSAQSAPAAPVTPVPSEVYFIGMIAREPILDLTTPLAVKLEDEAQGIKKSLNDIAPGKHVIHYVVSYMVRYFSEFEVKPGKNVIKTIFKESYLPGVDLYYSASGSEGKAETQEASVKYFDYDRATLKRVDYDGKIAASVAGTPAADGSTAFAVSYTITVNGKTAAKDSFTVVSPAGTTERASSGEKPVADFFGHYYFISYNYAGDSLNLSVGASFKD
jgi:class 3 adenylate cyclase